MEKSMKQKLQFIMEGGDVVRFHTRPGLTVDTDARHSHGVALLSALLWGAPQILPRAELLMAALTHDLAEQYASDISAPSKRALGLNGKLASVENAVLAEYSLAHEHQLTDIEKDVLKLADAFDGMLYCCREAALGNRNVEIIWRRWCGYVENSLLPACDFEVASTMYVAIKHIYKESINGPAFDIFA